jgi:SAM-dependent methyltransferase
VDRERFEIHAAHEASHWWFTARRAIVRRLLHRLVPPGEGQLVVEVGCGTGGNTAGLSRDYACLGIDPSADAIRLAEARFPEAAFPRAEFVCGFAPGDLGFRMTEARCVLLLDVLEHVADDFDLLSNLLAVTRPGTRFLVTVPADERLWSSHDEVHAHYRRYDRDRLAATWAGLPVACRLLSGMNTRLFPLVRSVRSLARSRSEALGVRASHGAGGTDLSTPPWIANRLLHAIFAGESRRLVRELETGRTSPRAGVSLVAVLERLPGRIVPRSRPTQIAADRHEPHALQRAA